MTTWSEALIIGKQPLRDHDKLFTAYTREQGKYTFLAQGARKVLSKLSPHLEVIHHVRILCAKGKLFDRVTTVESFSFHECIKQNLEKLALVSFVFDSIAYCVKEGERDEKLFFLLIQFLERIEKEPIKKCLRLTQMFFVTFFSHLGHGVPTHESSPGLPNSSLENVVHRLLEEHTGIMCKSRVFYFLLEKKLNKKSEELQLS